MSKNLIIAGGGTGGHVLAGVAVADAWKKKHGSEAQVIFVGAEGGIEERLVPRAGYPLELLSLGRLNRVSIQERLKTLAQLPVSFFRSAKIIFRVKPVAVLGVGGYASGPLVLIARFLSFFGLTQSRTAILEQNSVPGMTNRILGRLVHQVFSAFPGAEKHFHGAQVVVTGNPVRAAIEEVAAQRRMSAGRPFVLFIFGGSQGAQGINTLVLESLPFLKNRISELQIVHQTGERDFERVRQGYAQVGVQARVEKFIFEMPEMYAQASLIICRAGSSTLSEIAAVGRASILIPFPQASDNHQEYNARVFSDVGAAILMIQGRADGAGLSREILELLNHPEKLEAMESKALKFHYPAAAGRIVSCLTPPLAPS